jgi:LuxR family maltose regulon positive regulatory protein
VVIQVVILVLVNRSSGSLNGLRCGRGPTFAAPLAMHSKEESGMSTPLLETKLFLPRPRRGLVARPRLRERLHRGLASRLMLVSAPAGFGKTTLLVDWMASVVAGSDEIATAWLSLDAGDNDPATFWQYVIAALRTATPGIGADALELLREPQPPPMEHVLTSVLNDLASTEVDVLLLLDDYHVIDSLEVQTAMAFLLDHLPSRVHLVIASRADPALPLPRFDGSGPHPWRRRGAGRTHRGLDRRPAARRAFDGRSR